MKHGVNTTVDICPTFLPFNGFSCLLISIFRRDASICIARISYGNVSGWVAVCHSRYCIKTNKSVLKLFPPSGSAIIESFGTPCADTKFQGEPLHRGYIYTRGWEKLAIFDGNGRYLGNSARYDDGDYGTVNRKLWVPDSLV